MPATAVQYGVTNAYDPVQNIRAGVAYLKRLLDRYSHNEELALAAYNAGPAAVEKYGAVPPYRETREYVSKIRSRAGSVPPPTRVYRIVETKGGRETVRYTNVLAQQVVVTQ
jgi:soluble lytic murein transglycosylase-like protein